MLSCYAVGPSLQNQRVPNCIIYTFDNRSTWVPTLTSIWASFHCLYTTHHYLSVKICYSFLGKIQMHVRSEKCIRIHSDSQEALKAFQAAQTTFQSVWQCQRALNDISTHHSVELFWVSRHPGICGNETANELISEGSVHQFFGMEPAIEISRQNIKKKINTLKTKRRLFYLKIKSVPCSKHLGYKNQSVYGVSGTSRCLFWDKYKTHKYSMGRTHNSWTLNLLVHHITSRL
jgi:ribonuclease HI